MSSCPLSHSILPITLVLLLLVYPLFSSISPQFSSSISTTSKSWDTVENELKLNTDPYSLSSEIDMDNVSMEITKSAGAFDSYTLFQLYQQNRLNGLTTIDAVIMDIDGTVIAQKDLGTTGAANCPMEFIDPNTVLLGTEWGAALWQLQNDSLHIFDFRTHHDLEYNPNSNTIFAMAWHYMNIDGIDYRFDYIREYTLDSELVWSIDSSTFISTEWWCPSHDMAGIYRDISHGNTVFYDVEEDIIYYNSRNTNTFFKIDHSTSEVIWGLGEYGNFTLYDINGNQKDELFYHAHAVEKVNNNTFILFDNDYHNQDGTSARSRIVEITIDENTMTANESWVYEAPMSYFSAGWGDADRLPNGNRIGDFGYVSFDMGFLEVNQNHNVVWEAKFTQDAVNTYGSYRLERFRYEPIITHHADILSMNPVNGITWDVFYNYRTKQELPGTYILYLDGEPIQSGDFVYAKFWNPTTLSFDLGSIEVGEHELSLAISDGYGHTAIDTCQLMIQNFYISRSGLTTIEKTQTVFLPTWSGGTDAPLTCNISLNNTIYSSFLWDGDDIVLDPDMIDVGSYLVLLELYNDSLKVYEESFWLEVYPAEAPVIESLQASNLDTTWSESVYLSWNFFDATGQSWTIYIDGSPVTSDLWTPKTHHLVWNVPFLTEGTYNVTLAVQDLLGLVSTSEIILTVLPPTSPHIISYPEDRQILWGTEDILFTWEVYGGTDWVVHKNGYVFSSGEVVGDIIELSIDDWRAEDWRPGENNITLVLTLDQQTASATSWVTIIVNRGDPYADSVVQDLSQWYRFGNNSIGEPDGQYSLLFVDYENGYITLDMGENEEIIDDAGSDFKIYARGDEYKVSLSSDLLTFYTYEGTFTGTTSFDLENTTLSKVRYVRISLSGAVSVEIDAIEALYYNILMVDDDLPSITPLDDIMLYSKSETAILDWTAFDATPWSYEIYINSTLVENDWWYGSDVIYEFSPESYSIWNITIVFYDAFDNAAIDQVMIRVQNTNLHLILATILLAGAATGFVTLVIIMGRRSKL